jgi:hypothetical protein
MLFISIRHNKKGKETMSNKSRSWKIRHKRIGKKKEKSFF